MTFRSQKDYNVFEILKWFLPYCAVLETRQLVASQIHHGRCTLDTFQDFLIAEHMKPRMHILEISISSLNHVILRPTKTPKLADKKYAQFY